MPMHVKVSGAWKQIEDVQVNVSSVWKRVNTAYVKVSGVWKIMHQYSMPIHVAKLAGYAALKPPQVVGLKKLAGYAVLSQVPLGIDEGSSSNFTFNDPEYVPSTTGGGAQEVILSATGADTWTVPADWNSSNNTIECWGAGGNASQTSNQDGGGGGGAYSKTNNVTLTPSSSVDYFVGASGGQDTFFGAASFGSSVCAAEGGSNATSDSGAQGGQASNGIGDTKYSGGNGGADGAGTGSSQGGGGAAAGPDGDGGNGGNSTGGPSYFDGGGGGANGGTNGGVNSAGTGNNGGGNGGSANGGSAGSDGGAGSSEARSGGGGGGYAGDGGLYGGGAAGVGSASGTGLGAQGLIRIRYEAAGTPDNMELISNALTASAAPTTISGEVQVEELEAATENTDFIVSVSRDGGTTWSTSTLSLKLSEGSIDTYEFSTDVSGQPSGTSPRLRFQTANNKEIAFHGGWFTSG